MQLHNQTKQALTIKNLGIGYFFYWGNDASSLYFTSRLKKWLSLANYCSKTVHISVNSNNILYKKSNKINDLAILLFIRIWHSPRLA